MYRHFAVFAVVVLLLCSASIPIRGQGDGTVAGQVMDEVNAISLPGVPVELTGEVAQIEYTDLDGNYRFQVPAGSYQLKVVMAGYAEQTVSFDVVAGEVTNILVSLASNVFAEQVTVSAQSLESGSSTATAQMLLRMRAPIVQDNMGALEMSANDDSNAADAMARVTGISVVDGESVFVRGLGERYSNTTLAGATMPTTEPDRRVVPLDLFPTGMIDSVQVSKTYTPDKSPQFAGGLVEIIPLKMPVETSFDLGVGGGFNSLTTGKSGLSYPGGRPWNGYGLNDRALPSNFPLRKVVRGGRFTSDELGFMRDDIESFGESFRNVWDPVSKGHPMDQSYNGLFGGRFGNLGVITTLRHSQGSDLRNERQTFYKVGAGDSIERFNGPYDFQISQAAATVGWVGNLAYQFSPNHRLSLSNFYTHVGTDETRQFEGFNDDADNLIRNQRLFYVEEQIRSHHLAGDHLFPTVSNSRFDWKLVYSIAERDEPDLREVLYEDNSGTFVLADESSSGSRQFNVLDDNTVETIANYSVLFEQWRGLPTQVKFGGGYIDRARDFQSRRFRFTPTSTSGLDLSLPAEQLFTAGNIGPHFELREETRPTDTYAANQQIGSFYGMVDLPLSSDLRLVTGARVENFKQTVDTYDPFVRDFGETSTIVRAELNETDIFPAVNMVYALGISQNLRVGFSQTVNRPEFRELAPFEFTDVIGGRAIVGNPDVQQSLIQNFDARWEWFPGAEEIVSVSFFYKNFADPIERIVEPTASLRTSFTNAQSAKNQGLEFEARKSLSDYFLVGANYTYVDSEVSLSEEALQVQTSLTRPLSGTSKNLFNAMAEFRGDGFATRLLWNYFDDRISDVGSLGLPDIIEEGRNQLDLIFSKRWDVVGFKLSFANLTDQDYKFTQGGQDQRVFKLGRAVSFGVTYNP